MSMLELTGKDESYVGYRANLLWLSANPPMSMIRLTYYRKDTAP